MRFPISILSPSLSYMALGMCLSIAASCGKSGSSKDNKVTDPAVTASTSALAISGQLALSGLGLANAEQGVLLYQFSQGVVDGEPKSVTVDADGKFTAEIARSDEAVDYLVAQIKLPRDQRDWEGMLKAVKSVMPEKGGELSVEKLKNFSETEIQEGVGKLAASLQDAGHMTVLVAYTKSATGDKKAEASSFRFIGMPTAGNRSLSGFPNGAFKGNVDLGQVTADSKDAKSVLKADEALDLSADTIENLADLSKMLKIVKNAYMNKSWSVRPFYYWEGNTSYSNVIDAWSTVSAVTYKGYGFYVPSIGDQGLTKADVCGGKTIELTPPTAVNIKQQSNSNPYAKASFTNAGTSVDPSKAECQGGTDFYGRTDEREGQVSYMLNFGTGGSIQESPEGLWTMKVAGTEKGAYDLASALPIDANRKPLVFLPRAKFNKSGSSIVSVDLEFYKWTGTDYVKVTDGKMIRGLVSGVYASVGNDNATNKTQTARTTLTIQDNGDMHADFDGSLKDYDGTVMNGAVDVSYLSNYGFAIYYEIGETSYRTEFR